MYNRLVPEFHQIQLLHLVFLNCWKSNKVETAELAVLLKTDSWEM